MLSKIKIKNVNKKEIYIILLVAFDTKSCVLAKQCGAVTTSGCMEKIPCLWVQQDRKIFAGHCFALQGEMGCRAREGAAKGEKDQHVVRAARPLATKSAISARFGHLGVVTRHLLSRTSPPTHSFSLVSISPRIYAFFILPSISQFVVPCLVVFLFLPPSSDAPRCSSHSDFGVTTFQDRSAVPNCDANGLQPSLLASCFPPPFVLSIASTVSS